jgi:hypothetical protein
MEPVARASRSAYKLSKAFGLLSPLPSPQTAPACRRSVRPPRAATSRCIALLVP